MNQLIQQCIGLCGHTHGDTVFLCCQGKRNQVGHRFANAGASFYSKIARRCQSAVYRKSHFALFFAIFLPFVMPKIHDRYFFLADMLSVLYAARYRDRRFMPLLVVSASLMSYMPFITRQRPADMRILALMMLAALAVVSRDVLRKMRKNRAALAMKGGEAA